ncbi:MAG: FHA domain-containing protein [Bacteroidales bacterium]|nr:FHA domain-containing protein [Bacteroidales bacterium]
MVICPYCRAEIEDISKFCDQCGKELKYCPECKEPRSGTECPRCGEDLVPAKVFFSSKASQPQSTSPVSSKQDTQHKISDVKPIDNPSLNKVVDIPQGTTVAPAAVSAPPLSLVGNGWCLPLRPGPFGRKGGVYPEFGSVGYISGNHGEIRILGHQWQIQDFGSTNGTFIDGLKLTPRLWYNINKGNTLRIAIIDFKIS